MTRRREDPAKKRDRNYRTRYGISTEEYELMVITQQGKCAICRREPAKGRLHVDHDHETGEVRELLCGLCNRSLAYIEDVKWYKAAKAYLKRHNQKRERS